MKPSFLRIKKNRFTSTLATESYGIVSIGLAEVAGGGQVRDSSIRYP